jgi:hypothetical protein
MLRGIPRTPWFGYLVAITVGVIAGFVSGSPIVAGLAAVAFSIAWRASG